MDTPSGYKFTPGTWVGSIRVESQDWWTPGTNGVNAPDVVGVATLMKYGDVARNLYNQVGQQIDQAANSLMSTLGYYGARNDTFYPTTFLGSSGRNDGGFIVSASPGFSGATGALDATGA